MQLRTKYDVAVVGGGPVGCVAALAFAQHGAKVAVLEVDPKAAKRLAGEWLHPAGVGVLDRLRIGRLDGAQPRTGYGFVIVPDDGGPPVEMPYPDGVALSAEHFDIVESLREAARATPNIDYVSGVRVTAIDGHVVRCEDKGRGRSLDLEAARIVGADGRTSIVRQSLGIPDHSSVLSYMAGVELEDGTLPFEGFGHVILGGPGPALFYRIGKNKIRGILDVPITEGPRSRSKSYLFEAFGHVMPESARDAFRRALMGHPLIWASARFRPRSHFGKGHVALVGDAVGHTHPMTALGMTNGFLDAMALADAWAGSGTIADYEQKRRAHVPEVLSNALYHCFRRADVGATSLRAAMMDVLRSDAAERTRTLRIMAGEDLSKRSFSAAFLRMAAHATSRVVKDAPRRRDVPGRLVDFAEWMQWPVAGLLPQRVLPRDLRARTGAKSPLPLLEEMVELFRAPPKRAQKGDDVDPQPAIDVATARLLADLEGLAIRFGTTPDHELALPALRRLRAIDAARPGLAMSARLTMARRWLAREGLPRLLGLDAGGARDRWTSEDLAELISFVLAGDAAEPVSGLLEASRALDGCASQAGFGSRPGAAPTLHTTAVVLRALCDVLGKRSHELPAELRERLAQSVAQAAVLVRTSERKSGRHSTFTSTEDGADETAHAIEILSLAGTPHHDPLLRRAVASLSARQDDAGSFGDPSSTARALSALLGAGVPAPDAVSRAASALAVAIEDPSVELSGDALALSLGALGRFTAWRKARAVVEAKRPAAERRAPAATSAEAGPPPERPSAGAPARVELKRTVIQPRAERPGSDWEYCKEALGEVSRTFARPIALLGGELEVVVSLGYLLCRVADTVEDHTAVRSEERDRLFGLFLGVLERGEDAGEFARAFEQIPGQDAELDLARNLPRVMRVFASLSEPMQDATVRWVSEMARGMSLYTHRRAGQDGLVALETVQDLERYCYYVAGTVGHFLTDVFLLKLGDQASPELALALRKDAEDFAAGLQLVNILKDVTDDRARGWSFVPRTATADRGLSVLELVDPAQRNVAHAAVSPLFDIARSKLEGALRYTLTIPAGQTGMRLFCLLPLWMAARTLVVARGNDAMFNPTTPVKISREEVESIVAECVQHAGDDAYLRSRWAQLWAASTAAQQATA